MLSVGLTRATWAFPKGMGWGSGGGDCLSDDLERRKPPPICGRGGGKARAPHLSLSKPPEIVWGSRQRLGSSTASKREQDLPPRDLLPR